MVMVKNMEKIFHLSHLLDKDGYNRIDLISFYDLIRLDEYMEKFISNKDVRQKYDIEISEFCLLNMKKIKHDNRVNKRNWTGSIAIICEEKDNDDKTVRMYKIPIIYKNDAKLLSNRDCLRKIKEKLNDKETILDIFNNKRYMLSPNEIDLISLYLKWNNEKYLKEASLFFYRRLKELNDDNELYFYCRTLMHNFELNKLVVKTKFGNIGNISLDIPQDTVIEKSNGYSKDDYFNKLVDDENYEELFSIYSIDEIDTNSDMFERGRMKK